MLVLKITLIISACIISFTIGAVWLQIKETKLGKQANWKCEKCKALGCQSKFCKLRREKENV